MFEEVDGNEIVLKKVLTCKLSDGVHGMGLFALPSIVWPIFETLTRMKMRQAAAAVGDDDEKPPNGLRNLFRLFLRFWLFIVTDNLRLIKELLTTCFLSGSRWRLPHYPKALGCMRQTDRLSVHSSVYRENEVPLFISILETSIIVIVH